MNPKDKRSLKLILLWGGLAVFLSTVLSLGAGFFVYQLQYNPSPGQMTVSYHLNGGPVSSVIVYGVDKKWEGPFIQLDREGRIRREEGDIGQEFASTGYYKAGIKVGELTDEEVWAFLKRKGLMSRIGGR
ncbi:MAG: hypothetical protein AAF368_02105 [Planctomycetota bacterium]